MKLEVFKSDEGYRNAYLWIPKSRVNNVEVVKNSLTFHPTADREVLAYVETDNHLMVPRDYIPFGEWDSLPFAVNDRTFEDFPEVDVTCKADPRDTIQKEAHQALLEHMNGVLSLACGRGKTVVSIMAWCDLKVPALIVVHTQELMDQWRERIIEFTDLEEEDIGLFQGRVEMWERPVCLAMLKTLAIRSRAYELPEGFREHFGLVIFDEAHNIGAPFFQDCAAVGLGARWGLSATHEREDGLDALYKYHLGPVIYENLEQDIIPETVFIRSDVEVPPHALADMRDRTGEVNGARLMTWIAANGQRNGDITSLLHGLVREGRHILALSSRVDQLDLLADTFGDSASRIHGSLKKADRKGALYKKDLVFASTTLAKEGLDRKDLDTIVLLLPVAREGMFRQILGRGQRRHEGKQSLLVLIVEDRSIGLCVGMCRKLRKHLTSFGYPFRSMTFEEVI